MKSSPGFRICVLLLLMALPADTMGLIDEEEHFDPFEEIQNHLDVFERKIMTDLSYLETRMSTMLQQKMNRLKSKLARKLLATFDSKISSQLDNKVTDLIRDGIMGRLLNNALLDKVNNLERGYGMLKFRIKGLEIDVRELKTRQVTEATKADRATRPCDVDVLCDELLRIDEEVMSAKSGLLHLNKTIRTLQSCPPGFVLYRQSCYYFTNSPISWTTALTVCLGFGAELVKVDDREEDDFIVSQLEKLPFVEGMDGYWTSGHYSEDEWIWGDGTTLQYTRWAPGEPDHLKYHRYLAYIRPERWYPNFQWASQITWRDKRGVRACGAICEKPITS